MKGKTLLVGVLLVMAVVATINFGEAKEKEWMPFKNAERISPNIVPLGTSMATANLGNVLISVDSPEDDILPAITVDGNGNIGAVWTHTISAIESDFGIAYSTDNGNTWTSSIIEMEGYQYYADMAYVTGSKYEGGGDFNGFWGICLDTSIESGEFWRIPDITNPDTYEFYTFTEGSLPGASYASIEDDVWYPMTYYEGVVGPIHFYIDDDQNMNQGIMLFWMPGNLEGSIVNNWDAESVLDTAPAQDPDMACIHDNDPAWTENDFFYIVVQHNNENTGKAEIVYKKCVPVEEADIEYVAEQYYLVSGDFDAAHPEIDASGSNVVVVYMSNDNVYGDWDIMCKYSNNYGETWETSVVAGEHPVDETYPAVYMMGNTVYVAYIKEGNLYLVKSEDGGATWSEPEQINDVDGSVVAGENYVDICSKGIVWVDNRNGNNDIYFATLPAPIIKVSISGGFGVKANVCNEGTEAAQNVPWSVDLTGLVFLGKHAEGTIDTLNPGDCTTVGPGLVFGFGPTTITATVGGKTATASGFVLGPLVLGVS